MFKKRVSFALRQKRNKLKLINKKTKGRKTRNIIK